MSVKSAASKSSVSTIALICASVSPAPRAMTDVLAEFVSRVLQSGYSQDDHLPGTQSEGGAVEQLVDHLRPPGEDVGSVGEDSETH